MLITLLLQLLKWQYLQPKSKVRILNALLEASHLPVKDVLTFDLEGTVKLGGKQLTPEQARQLREGAVSLQNNYAYRLIKEQLAYEAIKFGIHSSTTFDMLFFSKSVLWIQQNEILWIDKLSGQEGIIDKD